MKLLFTFLLFSGVLRGQTWLQLADFPGLERDDGVAVNVNDKIYFGSGLTVGWGYAKDFYELDPATNTWTAITPLPEGEKRQYACVFPGPSSFFIFGGDGVGGPLNNLFKYDITSGTWSPMASKPGNGIFGSSCLEFGDKIIIIGGKFQGSGPAINEVWEYTISSNTWIQKNNFPFGGRFRASAAVINNTGYLMFGLDNNNLFRKEMYNYNPGNDSWTKILDFPQPKGRAYAALKHIDDKLVLFGGYDSLNSYHKDVWFFKPLSNTWSQSQDFASFGRRGGMSVVKGNKFYYSCGISVTDTRLKETWVLDVPLGMTDNQNNNSFSVYPNPAGDVLHISSSNQDTDKLYYTITDIFGREIQNSVSETRDMNRIALDVSTLKSGIYSLKLSNKHNTVVIKILKQ